jgi:hypothetical protein
VGSYISSGGLANTTTVARITTFVISALPSIGNATIRYTTDGSLPTASSASGASPLALKPASGTTLTWFADYGAIIGRETLTHTFTVIFDTSLQGNLGVIAESVVFNGVGGPVVTGVCPGASVSGSLTYTIWASNASGYCPNCDLQYVIGVDSVGVVGCVYLNIPPVFPGSSGVASFSFSAPTNASVYRLVVGFGFNFNCVQDTSVAGIDVGLVSVSAGAGCLTMAPTTAAATMSVPAQPPTTAAATNARPPTTAATTKASATLTTTITTVSPTTSPTPAPTTTTGETTCARRDEANAMVFSAHVDAVTFVRCLFCSKCVTLYIQALTSTDVSAYICAADARTAIFTDISIDTGVTANVAATVVVNIAVHFDDNECDDDDDEYGSKYNDTSHNNKVF